MLQKIFTGFSLVFALILLSMILLSRPTDFGPGIIPFALPFSIAAAGFALAAAILKRKE